LNGFEQEERLPTKTLLGAKEAALGNTTAIAGCRGKRGIVHRETDEAENLGKKKSTKSQHQHFVQVAETWVNMT